MGQRGAGQPEENLDAPRDASALRLFLPSLALITRGGYGWSAFRGDLFGGLTAAIIALPLALAFGVASGAGPAAGLYGAIAVGFLASLFGGTPAQVSGPTGPMTVVMAAIVGSHAGSLAEAFTIVLLGGLLQIVFGLLRVGRYVEYTPYSVISGFMTGIGVIILVIQTLPFLGLPTSTGGVLGTLGTLRTLDAESVDLRVAAFAAGCLAAVVFWPKRLHNILPAPLGVLVIGTGVATFVLPGMPGIGAVPSGLPSLVMPELRAADLPRLVQAAFILALLGSIDTLLTSLVADSVTRSRHDADKELVGQGLGNCLAGLLGGLPGAGATMRTVVNVRAGGRTPVAGMLHALLLLAVALGLGPVVSRVPYAVLAAILMKVGWDIIDWGYLKRMRKAPREKFVIMLVTLALTVFVDLIVAVAVGIILAGFVTSRGLAREQLKGVKQSPDPGELDLGEEEKRLLRSVSGQVLVTLLHGSFSYASARELSRRAESKAAGHRVAVYDFSLVGYVDTSAALAIQEMIELSRAKGLEVMISGLAGEPLRTLDGLGVLEPVPAARRFRSRHDAIRAAVDYCRGEETAASAAPSG